MQLPTGNVAHCEPWGYKGLSRAFVSRQCHGCGVAEQVYSGYVLYTDPHSVFKLKPFESQKPCFFLTFLFNFFGGGSWV
jgi:hypothetical protein